MAEFLNVALGFPTLPYSILLAFSALYWALAAFGIGDHAAPDGHLHVDGADHGLHGVSAVFARLGLGGAPVMLVVALLSFWGWLGTYFVHLFLLQSLPAGLRWGIGSGVALLALLPALPLTSWMLRPLRRLLLRLRPVAQTSLLGKVGVVASPRADADSGYATVDDGGAGLVLQVRAQAGQVYPRGERVVLVDYVQAHNHYLIAREQDLPGLPFPHSLIAGDKEIHR
ncbi:DUF1449 family protein [Xanthomonas sacchari]|uniref:DUF1449 family protein n=1 Tax=Xanthomonas sacchari TaxID=56458 RepID=A0AA46SX56_9XANT|nr:MULTISPECIES: DUF1449 family protein [Xanthomonas]KAB7779912.1 hypothetical protein CEK65_04345 [Xanthomonas sp. LMG 12459]KAB7780218.1 hypothetical protein CEK66_04500 [Xanthomonas sp. LMG 12460]MCW0365777.1 hypothetical protein [Xanthomonas sacchari]MCW0381119.1 hypothetical protein [Xanthomonas sacchari]MCW0389144.1 hypothetical protein [Xanthomonas sacchari]